MKTKFWQSKSKGLILLLIFAVVGPAVAQTCISPPLGLAHWWPGDNNPQDVIGGQSYEGLLINGTSFAPGLVSQAFSFDGVDDWISVAHHDDLNFGTRDFTVAMWMKFQTAPGPEMVLIEKWVQGPPDNSQMNNFGWSLSKRSDGLILSFGDGTPPTSCVGLCLISPVTIVPGQWYHAAALRRGDTFSLYWNGQQVQSLTPSRAFNLDTPATTTLKIGHRGNSQDTPGAAPFPPLYFHGLIDEVQIYNRALTDKEILAIYNAGSAGICSSTPSLALAGLTSAGQIYYTINLSTWINIPGQLAQLRVGDLNSDGKADLAGIAGNGTIWYSTNLATWVNVPGSLAQLRVGDLNSDGKADLAGIAGNGTIWYSTNLATWVNVPGSLAQLQIGDLNGDSQGDLAGIASNGSVWYTTNLSTWVNIPGQLTQLQVGDLNGDSQGDLAGIASNGSVWYTTDLSTWVNIPGQLTQLQVGDLNGDSQADLVGLASNGTIWSTTNRLAWTNIPGALSQLVVRDLNGDGHADLAGVASNGTIWYTTNLSTWTNIPGQLSQLAGDD